MAAAPKRVLLVEDDAALRESLAEQLAQTGEFAPLAAASGAEALAAAQPGAVDLVLLDVGLPDGDGRDICRKLRAAGLRAPIIMLTAAASDPDTVTGLESGANDYVTKPFRLGVLLARMRAQLRQHERSEDLVMKIGPYTFQPSAKVLLDRERAGKKVRLTEKEVAILKYLYRAGGRATDRTTLLTEVWGYNAAVSTHTLETHIYRLRQKIERDPAAARLLVTEPGGYKLNP